VSQPPPQSTRKAAAKRVEPDEDLQSVQLLLAAAGFDPGAADGIPGPGTTEAVRRFQAANGLRADGVADEKTLDLLSRMTANLPPTGRKASARRRGPAPARDAAPETARPTVAIVNQSSDSRAVQRLTRLLFQQADVAPPAQADGVLVFVSPAAVENRLDEDPEVAAILDRARAGATRVIPVVLRPTDWSQTSLFEIQAAAGARPLSELKDLAPVVDEILAVLRAPIPPAADGRTYLPGFTADSTEGVDLLGRQARVDFLASVLAAKGLETPLAVGLFGDWGSGKSFFMRRLQERIVGLSEASAQAEKDGRPSYYCSHVLQVTFNAWLYADSDIWPAFAAQVFRGVVGRETEAPQGETQQADLADYHDRVDEASARAERIRAVEARIEEKQHELAGVGADVGGPAGQLVGTVREIGTRLVGLRSGWRDLRAEDVLVLLAVVLVVLALALFDGAAQWLAWAGAGTGVFLAVLRSLDNARSMRAEVRGLREELAQERRALEEREPAVSAPEAPRLPEFAAGEVAQWSQRVKLGVVTEIRLKFERLSRLIGESIAARSQPGASPSDALPIDRVIVYVDDLDRCHHDVVVSVLETVKLLLSLPHFAVVVGVDSRWLFRSLELHFREVLRADDGASPDAAWAATPQNYLEKIFQHSVVLKPIEPAGFERLIDSLIPLEEPPPPADAPAQDPGREGSAPIVVRSGGSRIVVPPAPAPDVDLTPDDLRITRRELEFMKGLAPMFDTPRSVKRLANVYRLLRVSVGAQRLLRAESYEPALVLLSIGIAFPGLAGEVFDAIAASPDKTWPELVSEFDGRLGRALRRSSPEAVADRRLESFAEWIPVVDEFSFHPWRELLPRETAG
jgi:peptidoglycan hydrolase-like protein with peptidoglycan-binding domain